MQVGQPDRREDPVDPVPLEHGRGVVVVVAHAVVEGEHEAVRDRRSVARRREQRIRLERLVVAEQVLDLPLEVVQRDRRDARMPRIRVADVVVHDQDRAHLGRSLASGGEGALLDRQPLELAPDRLLGREDDVLEALRRRDRRGRGCDPREAAAEAGLGQPRGHLGAEARPRPAPPRR